MLCSEQAGCGGFTFACRGELCITDSSGPDFPGSKLVAVDLVPMVGVKLASLVAVELVSP
jgi:hypothetical protein